MVAFLSLFLGLVVGTHPVELAASAQTARVELLLDGHPAGSDSAPPWVVPCDFGERLVPHRLQAVAYDATGEELARTDQWINLPRAPAEAVLLVDEGAGGDDAVARLHWRQVYGEPPVAVRVSLDGEPLPVTDPHRIPLPGVDLDRLHFLRAELDFPGSLAAVVELTFGAGLAGRTSSTLTAVPVLLRGGDAPRPADLASVFSTAAGRIPVSAVEDGPSQIVLVVDSAARPALAAVIESLLAEMRARRARRGFSLLDHLRRTDEPLFAMLQPHDWVRFVWPVSRDVDAPGVALDVFEFSRDYTSADGSFIDLLDHVVPPGTLDGEQRLADAVAVAGLLATARDRRRAVVLIVSDSPEDASRFTPEQAAAYLGALRVPLLVWRVADGGDGAWGRGRDISGPRRLADAAAGLAALLDQQRIVWLHGEWLPQQIRVAGSRYTEPLGSW